VKNKRKKNQRKNVWQELILPIRKLLDCCDLLLTDCRDPTPKKTQQKTNKKKHHYTGKKVGEFLFLFFIKDYYELI